MNLKDYFDKLQKKHYVLTNLVAMAAVVLLLSAGFIFGIDIYTNHGQEVVVPDLQNKPFELAERELDDLDLDICVSDTGYVKKLAPGCILDQIPKAGIKTKVGNTIYVVINSASSPSIAIPDVIENSSLREAEARLKALGFKIDAARFVQGEKDWVYGVEYKGRQLNSGERVPAGAVLRVVAGDGNIDYSDGEDSLQDYSGMGEFTIGDSTATDDAEPLEEETDEYEEI